MLGVAAAHVLPHEEIRAVPEFVQIARDLHGPHGGRQQVEHERDASARDLRRVRESEDLLKLHAHHGRGGIGIVDGDVRAARDFEAFGRERVQLGLRFRREHGGKNGAVIQIRELVEAADAVEVRREPIFKGVEEVLFRAVREALASVHVQELDAAEKFELGGRDAERSESAFADGGDQEHGGVVAGTQIRRLAFDRERADGFHVEHTDAQRIVIPDRFPARAEEVRQGGFERGDVKREREADRRLPGESAGIRHCEIFRIAERIAHAELGGHAVGEQVFGAVAAGAPPRDAVGVGRGDDGGGVCLCVRRCAVF